MNPAWPTRVSASTCETYGQEPMVGVGGVTGKPFSARRGEKGIAERAEPFRILRKHAIAAAVDGIRDVADYENWLDTVRTFVEGKYLTLREALSRYPVTSEELAKQKAWQDQNKWPPVRK